MLFRVRSHKGDARSAWSKYYPIEFVQDVNAKIRENKAVSSSESYRDYSFSYTKDFTEMFSSYRLKLSEQSDLSSPVYVQESEANKHEFNYYRPFRLPLLKPNQNYRLDLEVFSPKEDYSMNRKEGVWRTISKSFRTGVSDFQEYVTLHSAASDTSLGEFIKIPVLVKGNYTYTLTEKGLHQWKGKELHTYHLGNTNSKISNRSYFTEDALGQFITVTPTSSRSGGYEGAFPLQVYDYTVWNEENMSPKSSLTFSLPTASHYIMGVQAGIIITNLGLFRIQENKLQKLNISDLEFYTVNTIQASDGVLWVTPHLQLHGCVVRGYSEDGQVLHALNSCSPIASDKTGNVYYIHDREKRLYSYNLDSRTHELQNVYIGSDLKGVLSDPYGGIHLYVQNQGFRHLLSFDDGQWRHNSNYFYTDPNKEVPQIDRKGNWWGNSSSFVTQVDPCYGTNAPIVSKKEEDGNVFLLAQGCRSTLWSWETPLEKKEDVLQGNRLQIANAEVGGTYTARCYNRGCLSPDAKIVLAGKYSVSLTFPSSLCGGQQLSVEVKTDNPFPAGAKLEFELSSGAKKYVWGEFASATRLNLGTLDVQAGVYDVALREVNGTNFSARYGTLEILPSPAVYLGGKANLCAHGSPQAYGLEITGGTAPFTYTWTVNGVPSTQTTAQYLLNEGATLQGAVKDKNGCVGASIPLVVKTIPAPKVTLSATISPDGKKVISVPEAKGQTYQWFLNNQSIPGANAPVHTAAVPGNYSVHVQNEGCTAISETFVVEVVLGAEESVELSVFPNPVQRSFAIEVEGHKGDKVEIMDPAGRVIWSQKIKKNGEVRLKVNAEGWASGIYHVVLPGKYRKLVKL